ncbi:hypothetical protein ACFQ60_35225 [Streptomyces zhihengii]
MQIGISWKDNPPGFPGGDENTKAARSRAVTAEIAAGGHTAQLDRLLTFTNAHPGAASSSASTTRSAATTTAPTRAAPPTRGVQPAGVLPRQPLHGPQPGVRLPPGARRVRGHVPG